MFFGGTWAHHGNGLAHEFTDIDAARFDAKFAAIGAGGFQQVANHGVQLIDALQHGFKVIHLIRRDGTGQTIQKKRHVLVNASERSSQFVRNVGEESILKFELLFASNVQRADETLALDSVTKGALQLFAGDLAFYEVILNSEMDGFVGERVIILAGKNYNRHVGHFLHNSAKGLRPVTVGKIQIEKHERGRFYVEACERIG